MFSNALPFATSGVFIPSLTASFGWQRAEISLGPALFMSGLALTTPLMGELVERYPARRLVAIGMMAIALCFVILSRIDRHVGVYYAAYVAMAVVGGLCGAGVLTAIVSRRFERARGLALGICMTGAGLATSVGTPIALLLVSYTGWRVAYFSIGLFVVVMTPLVWALLTNDQVGATTKAVISSEGTSVRQAFATPAYWWIMAAFLLVSTASTGLVVHFIPLLVEEGVSLPAAAALSGTIGITTIVARLTTGYLVDRWDVRWVSSIAMLLGAIGFSLFLAGGSKFAICGAIGVGISFGSETDLVGFMIARFFGTRHYGRLFGIAYGVVLAGVVVSPVLYGFSRDAFASYVPMLKVAVFLLALSAIILVRLSAPERQGTVGPMQDSSS